MQLDDNLNGKRADKFPRNDLKIGTFCRNKNKSMTGNQNIAGIGNDQRINDPLSSIYLFFLKHFLTFWNFTRFENM